MSIYHDPTFMRPTLADHAADRFWQAVKAAKQFVATMTQEKADRITRNVLLAVSAVICVAALAI